MRNEIFPERRVDGKYAVDTTQETAIGKCIAYLGKYMKN